MRFVRALIAEELTKTWQVLQCKKLLMAELERTEAFVGAELLRVDQAVSEEERKRFRRDAKREIKRRRKWAKRVRADWMKCMAYWNDWLEYKHDREAAKRLGVEGGS